MKKQITFLLALTMLLSLCACKSEAVCEKCNGEKSVACSVCNGLGQVECPEVNCENGISGYSCTNCGGREEIIVCTKCDGEQKETRTCETCGGDGIIVNPFTWEEFECGNCDGLGQAVYSCSRCGGYGLICTYCSTNAVNYPSEEFHPYYIECETCSGTGTITCVECMGNKEIPCAICASEAYEVYLKDLEAYKIDREKLPQYDEASELYSSGSYEEAAAIFSALGDYKDSIERAETAREELAKQQSKIETLTQLAGQWQLVSGNSKFFLPTMNIDPYRYELILTNDYLQIYTTTTDGLSLSGYHRLTLSNVENELNCTSSYFKGVFKVSLLESGSLRFEFYENDESEISDYCELSKLD